MSIRLLAPSRLALKVPFRLSPKTVVSKAMVLALVVAGFTVVGGGQALASHVGCGDTITTDTTLDSDLVNCPNNGIVIGANNITLDLNGHTIDGDGAPVDPAPRASPATSVCSTSLAMTGSPSWAEPCSSSASASSWKVPPILACTSWRPRTTPTSASSSPGPPTP